MNIALIYWISEAFQTYITYEVLATPSLYAYNKTRAGREILQHKLADFLYTRSTKLNGFVRTHVPEFIRDVILIKESWITGDEAVSKLRRLLCELFACNCDGALTFVLTQTNKLNHHQIEALSVSSTVNLVAMAADLGDLYLLRTEAAKDRDSLWQESPAFGYPLDVAVYAGHFGVAKAIAQQAVTNQNEDVVDLHHRYGSRPEHISFRQAICTCIELQHCGIIDYLLHKYVEAFGFPTEACTAEWLDRAVTCGHKDMLRLLLCRPTQAGISTFYKAFETACRLSKVSLLHIFFPYSLGGPGCLAINQVYPSSIKGYPSTYPLITAIRLAEGRRMTTIIKKLLELGADPNGPKYRAGLRRPLYLATTGECVSGILSLLDAGANPYLINDARWIKVQRKRYGKQTSKGKALRIALKRYAKPKLAKGVEGFLAEVAVKDVNLKPAFFGCTQS
ncbi:unnamed protein product [Alternaria alternata]